MLLFGFIIGLIITILGIFVWSYSDYVNITGLRFDSEKLGTGLLILGGLMSGILFMGLVFSTLG